MAHQITRLGFVNAYLVEEEDDLTLIDTTLAGGAKAILAAADAIGKPIRRIALTHYHSDHTGQVDALAAKLPGVEVLLTERDARILGGDKALEAGEPKGRLVPAPAIKTATQPLGDRVGSLEVHAAPGHSPGQVAFLDPRDGTLYCGDAYATLGGTRTSAKVTFPVPVPALATWHKPTALETAKTLRTLDVRALAPGHGKVLANPGAEMDAAIARGL